MKNSVQVHSLDNLNCDNFIIAWHQLLIVEHDNRSSMVSSYILLIQYEVLIKVVNHTYFSFIDRWQYQWFLFLKYYFKRHYYVTISRYVILPNDILISLTTFSLFDWDTIWEFVVQINHQCLQISVYKYVSHITCKLFYHNIHPKITEIKLILIENENSHVCKRDVSEQTVIILDRNIIHMISLFAEAKIIILLSLWRLIVSTVYNYRSFIRYANTSKPK